MAKTKRRPRPADATNTTRAPEGTLITIIRGGRYRTPTFSLHDALNEPHSHDVPVGATAILRGHAPGAHPQIKWAEVELDKGPLAYIEVAPEDFIVA